MSLITMEGFDAYSNPAGGNPATYVLGRDGVGKAMTCNVSTGYDVGTYWMFSYSIPAALQHNTIIMGHWHLPRGEATPGYYNVFMTDHVSVRWSNGTYGLSVIGPAGTVIHTTPGGIWPAGSGKYIEVKLFVHNTTGYLIVKLEGTTVINLTNIDTQAGASDLVTTATIQGMIYEFTSATTVIDDIYLLNGAGTTNNDFLGDCRVRAILPNGNGAASDWVGSDGNSTDNYLLVDEGYPTDVTNYVEASAVGATDLYAFADVADPAVLGMRVAGWALRTDSVEAKQMSLVARDASANEVEGPATPVNTTQTGLGLVLDKQPNGSNWTAAAANGMQFGFRVKTSL